MASLRKVRVKKLNVKAPLAILKEQEIDATEYESLTQDLQVATGVESAEETEYHLQAVLRGAGISADKEIPVPPPKESSLNYGELYPCVAAKPATYIRFSQTVEECTGTQYNLTEEDDVFLKEYNAKRPGNQQLAVDHFEAVMDAFEETAMCQTPFAAVDNTVASYDLMVGALNALEDTAVIMPHAKAMYEYWESRRLALGNTPLQPTLKFETHQESDELDPYVCFRRREVRQTRKTRARDVQSADKLKRLRRELETGRQLIDLSLAREQSKLALLKTERIIFDKRAELKEAKIRLGIKSDDEDLINQKPQKRKAPDLPAVPRPAGTVLRLPSRPEGRSMEADLTLLVDRIAEKENELRLEIETKIQNHQNWNKNHVDLTRGPLEPLKGQSREPSFRAAQTQYLMTPPASASAESMDEPTPMDLDTEVPSAVFQFKGVPPDEASSQPVAFRRRIGRLNRLWIDRRSLASPPRESQQDCSDRWKYDQDDSDDEQPKYDVDPYDTRALRFRATIPLSWPVELRRRGMPLAQLAQMAHVDATTAQQHGTQRPMLPQPPHPPQLPQPAQQPRPSQRPPQLQVASS